MAASSTRSTSPVAPDGASKAYGVGYYGDSWRFMPHLQDVVVCGRQQHAPHLARRARRHFPRVHARRRAARADRLAACEDEVQGEQGGAPEDSAHSVGNAVCEDKRPVDHQPACQSDRRPATSADVHVGCTVCSHTCTAGVEDTLACGLREARKEVGTSLRSM